MQKHKPDYFLLIIVLILVVFGLIMIGSISVVESFRNFGWAYYYLRHQLVYGVMLGLLGLFIAQKIHYKKYQKITLPMLVISLGLLALVFIPGIGYQYGGARRWLQVANFSIQPVEIVKLSFVLYLAAWLAKKSKQVRDFSAGFLPFVTITGLVTGLLIFQPDIGTLGLIAMIALVIFFMAGARVSHLALCVSIGLGLLFFLTRTSSYRLNRFLVFFNPGIDSQGIGYQINQAMIALGSGGISGLGLGNSQQKYGFLPGAMNDSIFAIIGEELGLIGLSVLLFLFLLLALRGFRIAKRAPDDFSRLTAYGITAWFIFQSLIHMAGLISLMPLTGIPLPFISYGGSAMIVSLIGIGILLNISKHTK